MSDMRDLDALIEAGWGDTPQTQIPLDWRTKRPPQKFYTTETHEETIIVSRLRKRRTVAEIRADRERAKR